MCGMRAKRGCEALREYMLRVSLLKIEFLKTSKDIYEFNHNTEIVSPLEALIGLRSTIETSISLEFPLGTP